MEELDLLKKDWKKSTNSFKQLSEMDIYKMIHKKSSSIVKWILVLSILEVAVWTALGFVFNSDDYLEKISNSSLELIFNIMTVIGYGATLLFIFLFYKNYIRITTVASTKQLMKDILRTRKTVQYYVWYNLAMIAYGMMVGIIIAFTCSPEIELLREKTANSENNMIMVITFSVVLIAVTLIFGLFWLFYRLLYGTLLRRLYANYKELKKIDL
jgi:predicted PurR-regulated permease PerM